jgi:hypothetical protein
MGMMPSTAGLPQPKGRRTQLKGMRCVNRLGVDWALSWARQEFKEELA